MGQKSRNKKHRPQQKSQAPARAQTSVQAVASNQPSLIQSSATFKPKSNSVISEELLQIRPADIRRIGWLILVMTVLLVGLGIANAKSTIFQKAGDRLSHIIGIQAS